MPGRGESEFLAAIARSAGPVRGTGIVLLSAFGVLSAPGDALPAALGVFALVLVGAVADFGPRGPALVLAGVRVAAVCVAQAQLGGAAQWPLNVLTTTAITIQWEWPPKVTAPVTAGLLAVHVATVGWDGSAVLRVVVECALARLAFRLLLGATRRVDALRARRAALERAEAVALERHRRDREYLALLHDTASATFLVVAVNGRDADPAEVAGYARRDLELLTAPGAAVGGDADVGAALRAVVERSPLEVEARWAEALVPVPVPVALALVRATREALLNVERHAGSGRARVVVAARGGGVEVVVSDEGRGFDVAAVSEHRRGVRGSIVGRVTAVGGYAEVTSGPGGTTVRAGWPRP
ncbi:sensor histidine kinase [Saccharothrix xinjiangensis]|uniref:Sensor histidine kinase n=1 Tax=Saccharothrix xinjiangensis TaxID=204798 RepID=A0ABV9YBY9_9PSEU